MDTHVHPPSGLILCQNDSQTQESTVLTFTHNVVKGIQTEPAKGRDTQGEVEGPKGEDLVSSP